MENDVHMEEKRILRLVCSIAILAFSIIALYSKDSMALIMGVFVSGLIAYGYFIISKYFPDGDKYIFLLSSFLTLIGLIMLYRIKPYYAVRQLTWFTIGISLFILIVVLLPDMESISGLKYLYMGASVGLLLLTQFIGIDRRGSKNWIDLGFTTFQPSEFSKIFIILYLALALKDFKRWKDLIVPAAVVGVSLILLVLQKDLGTALIFFCISLSMVYVSTSKMSYVLYALGLFLAGAFGSYFTFSHVRQRVQMWINPWSDPNNLGYQIVQSMFAIASGGFLGTGLYLGHPEYIPEVETDMIFSIICEELGLLGGFAIIIAYFLLIYRGFRSAIYSESNFSKLVSVGLSTMIGSQVFVIIGGTIKLIPLTGITLPLISYGGSSMVITFIGLGILQKVSEN
jgi:cell division protein FtsW (lipid II flippase)